MEDAKFLLMPSDSWINPLFPPQVPSLMLCKMQRSPCLQSQGCQGSEAVAGVFPHRRNGLGAAPGALPEGWNGIHPPSPVPCPPEAGWAGKGKQPGREGARLWEGRRAESYLPINQDINLNYEHLKKTEVHAKEYSVRQGSLWCHLFSWQAAEIAAIEEVPSS